MFKLLSILFAVLKKALFKDSDEYDVKSHKFDAFKVSIFLFVILACVFNVYAIKTMGGQMIELREHRTELDVKNKYITCIKATIKDKSNLALTTEVKANQLLFELQKCNPGIE